jgi:acyl-CoA thioester hydrolase
MTWTARVRYVEVDQQGVVFNAHYLTWCDEALAAFCTQRDLTAFAERVHLKASTLVWTAPARWGQTIEITVRCSGVGRTSATLVFDVHADGRPSCRVETVYVLTDADSLPKPIDDGTRGQLLS